MSVRHANSNVNEQQHSFLSIYTCWRSYETVCARLSSLVGLTSRTVLYLLRLYMVSHGLLIWSYTDMTSVPVLLNFTNHTRLSRIHWLECNSDQATVSLVVCTSNTGGQSCKPCVLCEIGFTESIRTNCEFKVKWFELDWERQHVCIMISTWHWDNSVV